MLSVLAVFAALGGALFALRRGSLGWLKLGAVRWGSPRWGSLRFARAPARSKSLATMERLALTPQHSLHLVRIQGREVVVATHPHGCTLLSGGCTLKQDESKGGLNSDRTWSDAERTLMNEGRAVLNDLAEGTRP
jgi:hypothetical protein